MDFKTKYIEGSRISPASIIEITVSNDSFTITEDITDLNSKVDEDFIFELRQLADELEEHNEKLKTK